ncbi:hypothetical protein APHWI1_0260 [Anaplasma phagocytophilum str. ApWI1]|uniref:Uncharacterized protein n=1 Tax=Anaplasma phagocytophilum str. ApWI1 TaxID=1359155 RepID=A0A0F3Q1A7_ANAPH|nr:hypothetical protein APHWI1_0260 [Anaplasma phagocytophilum str. ApWI1]
MQDYPRALFYMGYSLFLAKRNKFSYQTAEQLKTLNTAIKACL